MSHVEFSWDFVAFPLFSYGDEVEPPLEQQLPSRLVRRLRDWSQAFGEQWDEEIGAFRDEEAGSDIDAQFDLLAAELRATGLDFAERPWWRTARPLSA